MFPELTETHLVKIKPTGEIEADWNVSVSTNQFYYGARSLIATDEHLIIGGSFENIGGEGITHLAKVNLDGNGSLQTDFNLQANASTSIIEAFNNNLLVGGSFTSIAGANKRAFVKINTADNSIDNSFSYYVANGILAGTTNAIHFAGNRILLGGKWTRFGDHTLQNLAAIGIPDIHLQEGQ